jgi:7-carboxy-7-deazaguanine synthase
MLNVSETFESIQGESTFSGLPFFFIRLSGCNLRCCFCDTTYAYQSGREMTVETLSRMARDSGRHHVLVTGGEPMLQPETPTLLADLVAHGRQVLLETNGSILLQGLPPEVIRVMDIKTPSSGQSDRMEWRNIELLHPWDEVKFVVANLEDCHWAAQVIRKNALIGRCHVLFSPVENVVPPAEVADWLLHSGLECRFQIQLHKHIWGAERRGV